MDAYHDMSRAPESNTAEEILRQRARFICVWQVLVDAELTDEYNAWKSAGHFGNEQNPAELRGCFAFKLTGCFCYDAVTYCLIVHILLQE